jgi:uncharacterized RDD family membrane protein YckC
VAEIVTGDAVVLEVSAAAFPSRIVAQLIDMIVQLSVFFLMLIIIVAAAQGVSAATGITMLTVTFVLVFIGYPTIFETVSRGKTLGKLALGIRVVSDDGGTIRFRQALVRALAAIFEIWILPPVALITSMVSAKGKRLGDMFAGTYVISERVPRRPDLPTQFASVPAPLTEWAARLELSGLPDADAEAAASYLRRFFDLHPAARDMLGARLAATVAARVSPPPPAGTPPVAFLAAVRGVGGGRDTAWWAGQPHPPTAAATAAPASTAVSAPPAAEPASGQSRPGGFAPPA